MVMMGRTVQSTTQRRDAMLDILRRRSNNLDFVSVVVGRLLSSSIGISARDEKRGVVDRCDFAALGLTRKDAAFALQLVQTLFCVILCCCFNDDIMDM